MKRKVLVTGSAGLVGSEAVRFFCNLGFAVVGLDNNMRKSFFGREASTAHTAKQLKLLKGYTHVTADIRNEKRVAALFREHRFSLIIHTAAQPSHDWAAGDPKTDFSINATATLGLLELYRTHCPDAVFLFTSTNKVYGDLPNALPFVEKKTRWELPSSHQFYRGIDESLSIDHSVHSLFGASKVSADIFVQEYGRYFHLATGIFRCGCITGPSHAGARQHGFLSYVTHCIATGTPYTIYGYKGKQVRDNIHAYDLVTAFYEYYKKPKMGEVYNMGGGRHSNISVLEAISSIESLTGKKTRVIYKDSPRRGDHQWYISDVSKFQHDYPKWNPSYSSERIVEELCRAHASVR